jgi:hypothetical protein
MDRQEKTVYRIPPIWLLNNTVFYKVSHHLSQNGTPAGKGVEMMTHPELAAMATLDLKKIMSGWRNTMPNDFLGAGLLSKASGRLFFLGDCKAILKNIETKRVSVRTSDGDATSKANAKFDNKLFIEFEVS